MKVNFEELNEAWRNVEAKHNMYTTFSKDSEVEESKAWIAELQSSFSEAMEKQVEYIGSKAAQSINQSINFIYPRIYSVALKC